MMSRPKGPIWSGPGGRQEMGPPASCFERAEPYTSSSRKASPPHVPSAKIEKAGTICSLQHRCSDF